MVHIEHAVGPSHHVGDAVGVDVLRHGVDAHAQTFGQQLPCRDKYHYSDDKTDNRVDDCPSRVGDDNARNHHSGRYERVGQHVEEGAAGVDVMLLAREHPRSEPVDDDGHSGCPGDKQAVDGYGVGEFVDALHHDSPDGNKEDDGVEQRDEDGTLAVAIGETFGGMGVRQLQRHHGE